MSLAELDNLIDFLDTENGGVLSDGLLDMLDRFVDFHLANPHVYSIFCDTCKQYKAKGYKRWSHKSAIEVVRWQYAMNTVDPRSHFKINDHYSALYARMLMANDPGFEKFFEIRSQRV